MIILGLTGSIGMGKSTTSAMFADAGVPVYDADKAVHNLYTEGGAAVGPLSEHFPQAVQNNSVDRAILRQIIAKQPERLVELESLVHPLVGHAQIAFREKCAREGASFALLDIPLLFETGGDQRCDFVCVVTAPAAVQRARVLARPDMDAQMLDQILAKQVCDAEKRARADLIISTGFGMDYAREQVQAIIRLMNGLAE